MKAILLVAAVLLICATGPATAGPTPPEKTEEAESATDSDAVVEIGAALDAALAKGWNNLHLLVECQGADGMERVEVFSSGVATWGGDRQFELSQEALLGLLGKIRESRFADLEEFYGGPDPVRVKQQGVRIPCRVRLEIDGIAKQVAQRLEGEQSEVLKRLALEILDLCRQPGLAGVSIASLSAGLDRLARGELRPEALRLLVHRKPEPRSADGDVKGWLLKIVGRWATIQSFTPGTGYGVPVRRQLGDEELAAILGRLLEEGFESLPSNLYSEHYTDISVEILGRDKRVQARRFAGMTRKTHGREQERFDRILAKLSELPAGAAGQAPDRGES
ncbi:MAG: hypothetical protein GY769_04685 [bacterium]|nr:hypothetical protein [bacterium]